MCGQGDVAMAEKMIKDGWKVTDRDAVSLVPNISPMLITPKCCIQSNATPLIWAASEGHLPMVKFLLQKGAKLDTKNIVRASMYTFHLYLLHCFN